MAAPSIIDFDDVNLNADEWLWALRTLGANGLFREDGPVHPFGEIAATAKPDSPIIVCPFSADPCLELPIVLWSAIIQYLRSYGRPVLLLGEPDQRFDPGAFTEADILCRCSAPDKLAALAGAQLIVGSPNVWMWAATAWEKPQILFYPYEIDPKRWFPWVDVHDPTHFPNYCRIVYETGKVSIPIVLSGLRLQISML